GHGRRCSSRSEATARSVRPWRRRGGEPGDLQAAPFHRQGALAAVRGLPPAASPASARGTARAHGDLPPSGSPLSGLRTTPPPGPLGCTRPPYVPSPTWCGDAWPPYGHLLQPGRPTP